MQTFLTDKKEIHSFVMKMYIDSDESDACDASADSLVPYPIVPDQMFKEVSSDGKPISCDEINVGVVEMARHRLTVRCLVWNLVSCLIRW